MSMSRNVYLPDDLAGEAKKAGLNISSLTQDAIRSALSAQKLTLWQQQVSELGPPGISHESVIEAVSRPKGNSGVAGKLVIDVADVGIITTDPACRPGQAMPGRIE